MPRVRYVFTPPLGPNKLLVDTLHIHEELGRLFEIRADLLSEDDAISLDDLLGQKVDIELDDIYGGMRVFNAFVTEFVQVGIVGDLFHYQATLHPWVWFLPAPATAASTRTSTPPPSSKSSSATTASATSSCV
jgi:type VI secretion system secreted protein VgrG